jgi:mannonate dehydratase
LFVIKLYVKTKRIAVNARLGTRKTRKIRELFKAYEGFTLENLFENAKYFLQEIIPVAEENSIKLAIHPDDPPWSIFGLPRLIISKENIQRYLNLIKNSSNGLTLCTVSLGSTDKNDIVDMIEKLSKIKYLLPILEI